MGGLFKSPKPPAPPAPPPSPVEKDIEQPLTEDRLRRQKAAGRQGNIISSLSDAVEDQAVTSRISRLLG